jgi:hypothetical protein
MQSFLVCISTNIDLLLLERRWCAPSLNEIYSTLWIWITSCPAHELPYNIKAMTEGWDDCMLRLLVSNVPFTARQTDAKLVNPVDIIVHCGRIWVSVLASNLVQQYDKRCGKLLSSVSVPTPTGLASHCNTLYVGSQNGNVYTIAKGATTTTTYLTITGGGSIEGIAWLKGLLYISVSDRGYVGVYKNKVAVLSIMNDGLFSFSFKPFGIRALDGKIYITYSDSSSSVGSGYVDVYDPTCKRLTNLIVRDALAYPYGLVMLNGVLLVGNRGTGRIWSFDKDTGERVEGPSENVTRSVNDGLMGMTLDDDIIYFVAANDNGMMGSVGTIPTR